LKDQKNANEVDGKDAGVPPSCSAIQPPADATSCGRVITKACCSARSTPLQAQKRQVLECPVL
jgi:hypothetical protein